MGSITHAVHRPDSRLFTTGMQSPTLSEAELDLEQHLASFIDDQLSVTDDNPFQWDDLFLRDDFVTSPGLQSPVSIARKDSITIDLPMSPPTLPRRSSKRDSQASFGGFRLSRVPENHIASQITRSRALSKGNGLSINVPLAKVKRLTDDFVLSPIPIPPKAVQRTITPAVAENVILTILRNLESLDDLFATALVNWGFYRVFKRHELELTVGTLRRQSPAAWEHREIAYPGHDRLEEDDLEIARQDYTPETYILHHMRDTYIIAALKSLIKDKCQSFMRAEISYALMSDDPVQSARVDDALWRIWTFCKIFGSGKEREDDLVAQMDWFNGGELVQQKTCTHSVFVPESLDMNLLASAPECFAMGNEGGLSAEQLFDIMELWTCLGVLLKGFEGRTIQAREYGVYDNTDVRGGDIDGEEMLLDEWVYFILTFGLSPIFELAASSTKSDGSAFKLAEKNGWMNWQPPVLGSTRRNFLRDAASRVYEDKIAILYAESSTNEVRRQISKQRIHKHITQLRQRQISGEREREIIDTIDEDREWEADISNLRARPAPSATVNLVSHIPSVRSTSPLGGSNQQNRSLDDDPSASPPRSNSPLPRMFAQPLLPSPPPSTVPDAPSVVEWDLGSRASRASIAPSMPAIEELPIFLRQTVPDVRLLERLDNSVFDMRVLEREAPQSSSHYRLPSETPSAAETDLSSIDDPAVFKQHERHRIVLRTDADDTAERAINRIVDMGFTAEQARHALRKTDLGDGLRVDRAVEMLLRSRS